MRRLTLACLMALLPALAHADDVFLKGGGKVSGRILARTATSVTVDVGPGTITVSMDHVLRIEERRSVIDDYHERAAALRTDDVSGWLQLGKWATSQGLGTQARLAYEHVVAVDPQNVAANQALGHVLLDGRWVSEAEGYRARGYVQFEGQWMLAADRDAVLARRDAAHEADWARMESERRLKDAEARAAEAEARARQAEMAAQYSAGTPLWWGGWGSSYGYGYGSRYGTGGNWRPRPGGKGPGESWPPDLNRSWPTGPLGTWPSQSIGTWPSLPYGTWPSLPFGAGPSTHPGTRPSRPGGPQGVAPAPQPTPTQPPARPPAKPVRP